MTQHDAHDHPMVSAAAAVDDQPDQEWTAEVIGAEHRAALGSFTPVQARALARINRAFRESHLSNRSAKDAIQHVYEQEAAERNAERLSRIGAEPQVPAPDQPSSDDQRNAPMLRTANTGSEPSTAPRPEDPAGWGPQPDGGAPAVSRGFGDTEGSR